MTRTEWYHILARCMLALGVHPCALAPSWPAISEMLEILRARGDTPWAAAAEMWAGWGE